MKKSGKKNEWERQKKMKINIMCVRIIGFGAHIIPDNRRVAFKKMEQKCALDIESGKKTCRNLKREKKTNTANEK